MTDWKHYDSIYTERYMGTPEDNPKGYESSSPLAKARRSRADLLLIHGTSDDNVHLANTLAFVAALVKAGRPYALQVHPRQLHGFRAKEDKIAVDRALVAHFERTLQPAGAPAKARPPASSRVSALGTRPISQLAAEGGFEALAQAAHAPGGQRAHGERHAPGAHPAVERRAAAAAACAR